MDEKFETACFQIITYVGTARTHFINAIQCAKEGKYDEAAELIKQGDEAFSLGHNAHADLLTMDDINSGFIKSIGGQVKGRGVLIVSSLN